MHLSASLFLSFLQCHSKVIVLPHFLNCLSLLVIIHLFWSKIPFLLIQCCKPWFKLLGSIIPLALHLFSLLPLRSSWIGFRSLGSCGFATLYCLEQYIVFLFFIIFLAANFLGWPYSCLFFHLAKFCYDFFIFGRSYSSFIFIAYRLVSSLQCQSYSNWRLLLSMVPPMNCIVIGWISVDVSSRCSWVEQSLDQPGIFGAMNIGFHGSTDDWILFWGSDDWAPGPDILQHLTSAIESSDSYADLIVCKARYVDQFSLALGRISSFQSDCLLNSSQYRRSLFLGSTPPHQATLFGPGSRSKLAYYSAGFRLSADLDYFSSSAGTMIFLSNVLI